MGSHYDDLPAARQLLFWSNFSVFTQAERFSALYKMYTWYTKQRALYQVGCAPLDCFFHYILTKKKKKSHRVYVQVAVKVAARQHTLKHRNDGIQTILGLCPRDHVDTIPSLVRHHSKVELQRRLFCFVRFFTSRQSRVGRQAGRQAGRRARRRSVCTADNQRLITMMSHFRPLTSPQYPGTERYAGHPTGLGWV